MSPPPTPPSGTVLVLLAHPALERSRANRALAEAIRDVPGVRVHDLYEEYPDFAVDVPREQDLLVAHDVVVLQHPLYWYSVPALVKEWLDLVLEYGFAYGTGGEALRGKRLLSAVTTGDVAASYAPDGAHGHSLDQFLLPLRQTARLCAMDVLPPFVVHGAPGLSAAALRDEAARYRRTIAGLAAGSRREG